MPSTGGGHSGGGGFSGGSRGGGFSGGGSHFGGSRTGGSSFRSTNYGGGYYGNKGNPGCLGGSYAILTVAFFSIVFVCAAVFGIMEINEADSQSYEQTVEREPLDAAYVNEIDEFLYDGVGVLSDVQSVETALVYFYKQTGVQPYLYITDELNEDQAFTQQSTDEFMYDKYSELFTDEGHLFILYCIYNSNEDYTTWYCVGDDALSVASYEYCDKLLSLIDENHTFQDDYESMFSQAFIESADSIMEPEVKIITVPSDDGKRGSFFPGILLVIAFTALPVLIIVWMYKKKKPASTAGGAKAPSPVPKINNEPENSFIEDPWENENRRSEDPWNK